MRPAWRPSQSTSSFPRLSVGTLLKAGPRAKSHSMGDLQGNPPRPSCTEGRMSKVMLTPFVQNKKLAYAPALHTVPPGAPPIRIGSLTRPRRGRPAIPEPPRANVLMRSASMSGATVGQGRMVLTAASSTRSAVLSKDFGGAHLSVEFGRASKSARHGAAVGGVRANPAPLPMRWVR